MIASDNPGYTYAFYGEAQPLAEMADAPCREGQRVWVLTENSGPLGPGVPAQGRLDAARVLFSSPEWELCSETVFHSASALLFVRRHGADDSNSRNEDSRQ